MLERSDFAARIDDSICVGQRRPQDKDERVLLFMKMRAGHKLDQPFEQVIRTAIREALSARHVPAHIFEVKDIPVSSSSLACVPKERLMIGGGDGVLDSIRSTGRRSKLRLRRLFPASG